MYKESGATATMTLRSRDEVAQFFTGCEMVEPGVVPVVQWHPESQLRLVGVPPVLVYGGVGRMIEGRRR